MDLEIASKALKTLKQAGIATYVYLLFGTPPETEGDAYRTLDFTARHHDLISFLNVAIFNLPAYGPMWKTWRQNRSMKGSVTLPELCPSHRVEPVCRPAVSEPDLQKTSCRVAHPAKRSTLFHVESCNVFCDERIKNGRASGLNACRPDISAGC